MAARPDGGRLLWPSPQPSPRGRGGDARLRGNDGGLGAVNHASTQKYPCQGPVLPLRALRAGPLWVVVGRVGAAVGSCG